MAKSITCLLAAITLFFSTQGFTLSATDEHNINLLINGGPASVRNAAKNLYHTGETNTEILDVLAEVLLQNYHKSDNTNIDAMSWASKALGNSGLSRYRSTLAEVAENGAHRKLKKYAKKSLKNLGEDNAEQYTKGSISLANLREGKGSKPTVSRKPAKSSPTKTAASGGASLTEVKVGMSMSQAYALVGEPTATTTYQTGKAWIPFNFKGGDVARTAALYKGKGRIVFSNESHYSASWRVLEVLIDPNETGYP
ncbi:MAG: hypothetical protein H7A03_02730 [Pseudomonadales bacterium]|nr:hypothetical protein [Pseudomonadales bacterium]